MKKKLNPTWAKVLIYGLLYAITILIIISSSWFSATASTRFPWLRLIIIFFATTMLIKYFVYMLMSPWYDVWSHWETIESKKETFTPKVSVIIPAWNEEVGILHTLRSLLANTYRNLEIIVINDGSVDSSDALIRAFCATVAAKNPGKEQPVIIYHYKKNEGKGHALNSGISMARGEIIISIDADCIVTPTTVENFVKYFQDPTVMAAVGNVKIGNHHTVLGTIQNLEFLFSFYFKKADSLFNTIYIIGGAAGAFRRDVFTKVGMYNPKNITEDIELSVRIQAAGMKIVYAADAIVYTEGANDMRGLMKQRLRWKRGRLETFRDHKYLFFSLRRQHNKLLTYVVLPLAIFGEIQLFAELFFLLFLYATSVVSHDFSSFISGIIVVSSMFLVQVFTDTHVRKSPWYYSLAPIGWLLFYTTTFIEYNALLRALWGFIRKREIRWQSWQRSGLTSFSD